MIYSLVDKKNKKNSCKLYLEDIKHKVMRKKYLLSLDEEKTEALKKWLEKHNLSLSGYIEALISEHQETMKLFEIPKDASKMTIGEFARLAQKMMVNLTKK